MIERDAASAAAGIGTALSPPSPKIEVFQPTVRIRLQYGDAREVCPRCGMPTAPAYDGTPVDLRTAEKNTDGVMVAESHLGLCPNLNDRIPRHRRH